MCSTAAGVIRNTCLALSGLEFVMLWTIVAVLLILWLLGFSLSIAGSFIHLLLVIALVLFVVNLVRRR
jgi:hypothetical protein